MTNMQTAFAACELVDKARVYRETWGHLAPKRRRYYRGTILFCLGDYGDITAIRVRFKNLSDSPWFFDGMNEFIAKRKMVRGHIYRFEGTYRMCKNGAHQFSGKVRRVVV